MCRLALVHHPPPPHILQENAIHRHRYRYRHTTVNISSKEKVSREVCVESEENITIVM